MHGRLWRRMLRIAVVVVTLLVAGVWWAEADVLFGATGSRGVRGELVVLNTTNGAPLVIGRLIDGFGRPYGITGLAFQPGTSVLFGSTAGVSPTAPGHLVEIDPSTATVTDVGSFGLDDNATMSDITFDPTSGTLYGSSGGTDDFYTINLITGAATSLGPTGVGHTFGGGLAANATGTIFGTPRGASRRLFTYDKTTGVATAVALMSGAPFHTAADTINALAFDSLGTLFGINSNGQAHTHLITINPTTGVITDVGLSLDNLDAIAFHPPIPFHPALFPWHFFGVPGQASCSGQQLTALVVQFGDLETAAFVFGFSSIQELLDAIQGIYAFCGPR